MNPSKWPKILLAGRILWNRIWNIVAGLIPLTSNSLIIHTLILHWRLWLNMSCSFNWNYVVIRSKPVPMSNKSMNCMIISIWIPVITEMLCFNWILKKQGFEKCWKHLTPIMKQLVCTTWHFPPVFSVKAEWLLLFKMQFWYLRLQNRF